MGFWTKLLGREEEPVSDAVKAGRERHGIEVEEPEKKEKKKWQPLQEEPYDPWEEIRNIRSSFFIGNWARRRFKWIPDKDGLQADLEKAQLKREEKARKKEEKKQGKEG
ncbi:MAG: hypothetical protein MUO19_03960 [Dehalococcoidales bacterium]|nr:hypothetical protein [Dehalococcoidales bacterium]